MKKIIAYLPLATLFVMLILSSFAQQNQNTQKQNPEVQVLKIQLQTVENQKIELTTKLLEAQAKLADANTKLVNAEFGKFERELRDSNDEWLRTWSLWFLTILGIFVAILLGVSYVFWYWLRSRADQLIANSVEKRLDGFKKAVGQVNILQDQIRILEKEHAVSVLAHSVHLFYNSEADSEQIKPIPDRALIDLLADKTHDLSFRYKAMEILVVRESTAVISPGLELLNSMVDSDFNWEDGWLPEYHLSSFVNFLGKVSTQEVYEGLEKILDRLLSMEDQKLKRALLAKTTFSLARVSGELNREDSGSLLKTAIPDLEVESHENQGLIDLLEYFDMFNEREGIKEILTNGLTDGMPDVEDKCLELLQEKAPEFVEKWKAEKEIANTQNEEPS